MKKKIFVFGAMVIFAVSGVLYWSWPQEKPLTENFVKVQRGSLELRILSTGTVYPENRLSLRAPISGRVDQVLVTEGDLVKKGQNLAWVSSLERAALLDSARALGAAEVKKWEEVYKPMPILAPIAGRIIARLLEPGQSFTSADSIFILADQLIVNAQVDETDIGQIKVGQSVSVVLDAYAQEVLMARVERVAFDAKTINNVTTYIVSVAVEKVPSFMRSGMTANVTFLVGVKENVLLVDNESLKTSSQGFFVKVLNEKNKEEIRYLKLGATDGKRTEVLEGLDENTLVLRPTLDLDLIADKKVQVNPFAPMKKPRDRGASGSREGGARGGGSGSHGGR